MLTGNNTYTRILGGIAKMVFLAVMFIVPLYSCTDDGTAPDSTASSEKEQVMVKLKLDVGSFSQSNGTGTKASYVSATSDECIIEDIWVFQYNAETGASMINPAFIANPDTSDISVGLSTEDAISVVCIVANAGQYTDDAETDQWALSDGKTKDAFSTYSSFLQQALPESASSPINSSDLGIYGTRDIPMYGESKEMTIEENSYINVSLVRMLARLEVTFDPSYPSDFNMYLQNMKICNIPDDCLVGTLESDDLSSAATYPSGVTANWVDYDVNSSEIVLYIPENLQGTVSGMDSKQTASTGDFPTNALYVELTMLDNDTNTEYTYYVYPGQDMVNDFNIRRNYIYDVDITIKTDPTE